MAKALVTWGGREGHVPEKVGRMFADWLRAAGMEVELTERIDRQRRLIRLGYDPLRTEGTFGAGTRRAIGEWQADEGEPVTGYLTADQVRTIWVQTGGVTGAARDSVLGGHFRIIVRNQWVWRGSQGFGNVTISVLRP